MGRQGRAGQGRPGIGDGTMKSKGEEDEGFPFASPSRQLGICHLLALGNSFLV